MAKKSQPLPPPSTGPLRFALYRRVSNQASFDKDLSIPEQAAQQRETVTRHGGVIVLEFEEGEGISASREDRPQFQRMITAAKAREFDVLLIWKSDRVFRSRLHAVTYKHLLAQHGIRLMSVTESFVGSDDPTERLLEGIMECFSEWYLENIKAEVHKGLRQAAARGRQNGAPPYGYVYARTEGQRWAVDPETSPWVLHIFDAFVGRDLTYAAIARELNQLGAPSPTNPSRSKQTQNFRRTSPNWWDGRIKSILGLRQYIGEIHYRGEWMPGSHPPIVPREIWDEAQRKLAIPRHGRSHDSPCLFGAGILLCPLCRAPMCITSRETRKNWEPTIYYQCGARLAYRRRARSGMDTGPQTCPGFMISEKKVDALLRDLIKAFLQSVPASMLKDIDQPIKPLPQIDNGAITAALRTELATIPTSRINYIRLAGKGIITDETLAAELDSLTRRESAIEEELARLGAQGTIKAEPEPADAYRLLKILDSGDQSKQQKREAVRCIISHIIPSVDKTGLQLVLC